MPKVIKPSNPFFNVCWVSVLTTFSAYTNFGCIDSFLLPNSRNRKMMGDGSFGATAAGLFERGNLLSTHPVISRASAVASSIFHGVIPRAF